MRKYLMPSPMRLVAAGGFIPLTRPLYLPSPVPPYRSLREVPPGSCHRPATAKGKFLPLSLQSFRSSPSSLPRSCLPTVLLAEDVKVVLRACGARLHLDGITYGKPFRLCRSGRLRPPPCGIRSDGRRLVLRIVDLLERKTLSRF